MMILTYIMGHTLTISGDTAHGVLANVKLSQKPSPAELPKHHVSPRLANRQLKFFFGILRKKVYVDLLNWQQQTLHSSAKKESSWLPAFCVTLGLAMMLEEVQRLIWIQAASIKASDNISLTDAMTKASNACKRIDEHFDLLVGLFQCKYRAKAWSTGMGSFGPNTPPLRDPINVQFLGEVHSLLREKRKASLDSLDDVIQC
jgi:hypothetical protein